jgi:hypothetical protein
MKIDTSKVSEEQVDALLEEWAGDAKMDKLEPAEELRKVPVLQAKYMNILSSHRRALRAAERKIAKLKRLKHEYYTGRLDQDTLEKCQWQPFPYTLKGDLVTYMESDKDLLNGKAVLAVHEEILDICERILKELNSRTFALKDIVKWEMFIAGGGH